MIFPPDTCGLQAAVSLVARGINPEPWSYSAEQDAWQLICATVREGRLRAYIIVLKSGKTYEAERGQFAGLEGRLSEVRMRAVALRDSLGQNHWSPFCELFFYEDDLRAALQAEIRREVRGDLEGTRRAATPIRSQHYRRRSVEADGPSRRFRRRRQGMGLPGSARRGSDAVLQNEVRRGTGPFDATGSNFKRSRKVARKEPLNNCR